MNMASFIIKRHFNTMCISVDGLNIKTREDVIGSLIR